MAGDSTETLGDMQSMLQGLCDSFLESLEDDVPQVVRNELRLELERLALSSGRVPSGSEVEQVEGDLDAIFDNFIAHFPEGPEKERLQNAADSTVAEKLDKLSAGTKKYFEKDLRFVEQLKNHRVTALLNTPIIDTMILDPKEISTRFSKGATYKYQPLDFSIEASRLVVLQPGKTNDVLRCNLVSLPLSVIQNPDDKSTELSRYEALSYVWGSVADSVLISVDDQDFSVGRNLYTALIHLRLDDEERILWIDAMCINQDNVAERNWQVSRMGLIYRSALQTVAWLGPATWGSDMICTAILAFQMFQEGQAHILPQEMRNLNKLLFGAEDSSEAAIRIDMTSTRVLWDQLDQLFERSLFSRSWIVQEIVLGRQVEVHCGNIRFPHDFLEVAVSHSARVRASLGLNMYTPMRIGSLQWSTFSILRSELRLNKTEVPLYHYASRFGRLQATNPRDRIYAFLSLSPSLVQRGVWIDQGFAPDYPKPVLDVYRDFTIFCLRKYNNLDLLSRPYRNDSKHPLDYNNWIGDWPSWVPDWERRGIKEFDFGGLDSSGPNSFRKFATSGRWDDVEFVEVDGRSIGFVGVEFDEVSDIVRGEIFDDPKAVKGDEEAWAVWGHFVSQIGNIYGKTVEEKEEAYWRTLVADSDGKGSFAPEIFGIMFRAWRSNTLPAEMNIYEAFMDQLFNATRGRKLFLTKRGYLGLGSWEVAVGDMISILKGGNMPILGRNSGATLEAVSNIEDQEEGVDHEVETIAVYRLVGSGGTYIHGIMDGEAVGIIEEGGTEIGGVFFC